MSQSTLGKLLDMDPEDLIAIAEEVPLRFCKFLATYYPDAHVRREFLKSIGVVFSDDSSFANMGFLVTPNTPSDVHVYIGRNVSIAPNVTCICDSCANNGKEINDFSYISCRITKRGDIRIEDEAWIGANVTILPGVTVGRCAMIGAGCVLTQDAEPYGIYVGVPGRKVGDVRKWESDFESQR